MNHMARLDELEQEAENCLSYDRLVQILTQVELIRTLVEQGGDERPGPKLRLVK